MSTIDNYVQGFRWSEALMGGEMIRAALRHRAAGGSGVYPIVMATAIAREIRWDRWQHDDDHFVQARQVDRWSRSR